MGVSIVVFALTMFQARVYVAVGTQTKPGTRPFVCRAWNVKWGGAFAGRGVSCAGRSPVSKCHTFCATRYNSEAFKSFKTREGIFRRLASWRLISEARVEQVWDVSS
jgi:hypothetical protein